MADIEKDRSEQRLSALFADLNPGLGSEPPSFRELWPSEKPARFKSWPFVLATASALAATLAVLTLLVLPSSEDPQPMAKAEIAELMAGMESVSRDGPLDFLLTTPGHAFVESGAPISLSPSGAGRKGSSSWPESLSLPPRPTLLDSPTLTTDSLESSPAKEIS